MSSQSNRTRLFCHQCDADFPQDERGLRCPYCEGDFVEEIDPDDDPRATQSPAAGSPLHNHNPWPEEAPDPDESNISEASNQFFPRFERPAFGGYQRGLPPSFPGNRMAEGARPGEPQVRIIQAGGPNHRFTIQSSTYTYGGGSGGPQHHQPGDHLGGPIDISGMLQQMFRTIGAHPSGPGVVSPGQRGAGQQDPFLDLLQGVFGGVRGQNFGDFVSDNNFDQILSQLMEQHTTGNAPGPASQATIDALPKMPATKKQLGTDGVPSCSICTEPVSEGDIITELPCHHWYHPDCVGQWLQQHDTCPVCRKGITPKEGEQGTVRSPEQEPLHNEDPAVVAQRQTAIEDDAFFVPESPAVERRRRPYSDAPAGVRRHSSGLDRSGAPTSPGAYPSPHAEPRSARGGAPNGSSSSGLGDRFRNWVSGNGSSSRK